MQDNSILHLALQDVTKETIVQELNETNYNLILNYMVTSCKSQHSVVKLQTEKLNWQHIAAVVLIFLFFD